ncbi:hypothetical protein KR054_002869 [Drosophila jambulina]|nr:hypothetical protein KR054_002869 [Drosophila jambulina]
MLFLLILILFGLAAGQRLPPGVNPRRYQLPEHDHHQEYSYKQESPIFHHHHQESHHHHHHHHQPSEDLSQKILTTGNIHLERYHIQEHIPVPMDTNHMSDSELQFHYFKMHDSDDNNKLDGCELYKALIHMHDEGNKEVRLEAKTLTDGELADLIDPILKKDDTSRDGYIDYPEFIKARDRKEL